MYELKTKPTDRSPLEVIDAISHLKKREDAKTLLKIFQCATGQKPTVWGKHLIGYGTYCYQYATGHKGKIYAAGFSVTNRRITLHLFLDGPDIQDCLKRLGKHTCGKSCLYISKLDDVRLDVLKELVQTAWNFAPSGDLQPEL